MSPGASLPDRHAQDGGARPTAPHFDARLAERHPLGAFAILSGGDAFEVLKGRPPAQGPARAQQYVARQVRLQPHGASAAEQAQVAFELARLVSGNLELLGRLEVAKPLQVDLVPRGKALTAFGYPKSAGRAAIGLFWDQPEWEAARIALRRERLADVPFLAIHEMAHAIHFLAFTQQERDLIYRVLLPAFGSQSAVDEAFAIYTEREFVQAFSDADKRAPGVYGHARRRWSEDHLFTRFVRNVYFPDKPLAGPKTF